MQRARFRRRRFVASVLLGLALWVAIPPAAGALGAGEPAGPPTARYVVQEGDTLWGIATSLQPGTDPRIVVELIAEANGIRDAALAPGQLLVVPEG